MVEYIGYFCIVRHLRYPPTAIRGGPWREIIKKETLELSIPGQQQDEIDVDISVDIVRLFT